MQSPLWVGSIKEKQLMEKKWFSAHSLKASPLFSPHIKKEVGAPYKVLLAFYKKMR